MANQDAISQSPTEPLTPKQLAVARLVAQGCTDKQIAAALTISERRVRQHITAIARAWKLDPSRKYRPQIAQRFRLAA